MESYKRESSLLGPVQRYGQRLRFCWQDTEVQFYDYRIDLFAFSESRGLAVAVELKLHRWRRAIEQALIYQLCADRVFIGLPETTARRVDQEMLQRYGIGMIAISARGRCRQVVCSQQSTVVLSDYRETYIRMLKQVA